MKKTFWYPIVFMSILTAIFTFVLAFMEVSTADKVAENQKYDLQTKILYVFDIPVSDTSVDGVNSLFTQKIEEDGDLFIYKDGDTVLGYAFPAAGPGLWGGIVAYVGISED